MQPAGNVEVWLGEVERRMRSSVRAQVRRARRSGLVHQGLFLAPPHQPDACHAFASTHARGAPTPSQQNRRPTRAFNRPFPTPIRTPHHPYPRNLQIMEATAAYDLQPGTQWVCNWPAMVVLAVVQMFWSTGVEAAVAASSVPAYLEGCTKELMELTDLVRAGGLW
jgi:hypothetical protein